MSVLTKIEWLVLNETLDDAENLEQIYRALVLESAASSYASPEPAANFSVAVSPILLADIADAICSLVQRKLLIVRSDPALPSSSNDLSYVWRGWFEASPEARVLYSDGLDTYDESG